VRKCNSEATIEACLGVESRLFLEFCWRGAGLVIACRGRAGGDRASPSVAGHADLGQNPCDMNDGGLGGGEVVNRAWPICRFVRPGCHQYQHLGLAPGQAQGCNLGREVRSLSGVRLIL